MVRTIRIPQGSPPAGSGTLMGSSLADTGLLRAPGTGIPTPVEREVRWKRWGALTGAPTPMICVAANAAAASTNTPSMIAARSGICRARSILRFGLAAGVLEQRLPLPS